MADVQKPVVPVETAEAPAVEPTPAPVAVAAEVPAADKPVESVEPSAEEPAKTEGETAAPVEEKKEEKPVEPIYSGALGYKAPGLKNVFRFSKKYFWFGEDPVPAASLSQFLRGEKDAEHAHTVAAWSSVTGKGLLYFAKHVDQKDTPAGVLKLADATDLTKDGTVVFFFKLQGHKHAFEAQTLPERNSWYVAVEAAIKDAKDKTEEIVENETYKEQLAKLSKPATLAATSAKESTAPKKSTDVVSKEAEAPATEAVAAEPTRNGSASSASADEEKRKKASKSKSRSVSRGKRASIFGGFLGKKEKVEEKKEEKKEEAEEKKEEAAEAKPEEAVAVEAPVAEASTATEIAKPAEEVKTEDGVAPAAPAAEEKPKPAKRASIFGNFVERLKSPTSEKKEADLIPAPVAKDAEAPAEAPKVDEPAAEAATTEAPKVEETKPVTNSTPHKEKSSFSFGKFLGGAKEKVKTPTTDKAPASEAPKLEDPIKTDEAPVLAPVEPVAPIEPATVTEAPKEEEATPAVATTPPHKKRGSIFGNLTGGSVKKEKDGETEKKGLSGLFRSASKAAKAKKDDKTAKADETTEAKEEIPPVPAVPATEEKKEAAPAEATIGDVTADAVTVGQAPKSTSEVATTA